MCNPHAHSSPSLTSCRSPCWLYWWFMSWLKVSMWERTSIADSHHSITTHWLSQSCWVHMFTNENKVVDLRVAPYSCFSFLLPILSIDVRVYISHRYNGTDQHSWELSVECLYILILGALWLLRAALLSPPMLIQKVIENKILLGTCISCPQWILYVCICVYTHEWRYPQKLGELHPPDLELQGVVSYLVSAGNQLNSGPLEEQ